MARAARLGNHSKPWGLVGLAAFVAITIALLFVFAPNRRPALAASGGLPETAPLPDVVPKGTVLVVGDR